MENQQTRFISLYNMDNFDYAAHITYIMHNGSLIPWHVVFTSSHLPFSTYTIGLDAEDILFRYDDLLYNFYVDNFPRPYSLHLDECVHLSKMKDTILSFVQSQKTDNWDTVIGAVDNDTFWYLKNILPNTILVKPYMKSRDHTLATVHSDPN